MLAEGRSIKVELQYGMRMDKLPVGISPSNPEAIRGIDKAAVYIKLWIKGARGLLRLSKLHPFFELDILRTHVGGGYWNK